jgi:erythromycin esterase
MFQFILALVACLFSITSFSQVEEVIKNSSSFDHIDTINFNSFDAIGKSIGDAEIVFLGEQSHGDGTTFEVKTQLVKYLHEKKGFNVLLFESDSWSINELWEKNQTEQLRSNVFNVWSKCQQMDNLFQYILTEKNKNSPLNFGGFDCNHYSNYSKKEYTLSLQNFLIQQPFYNSDSLLWKKFISEIDRSIHEKTFDLKNSKDTLSVQSKTFISEQLNFLITNCSDDNWKHEFKNLKGLLTFRWNKDLSVRDQTMAENIIWLYNTKYKGQKLIVWAHNLHITKTLCQLENQLSTGELVAKSLVNKTFHLGFISGKGNFGLYNTAEYKIKTPKKNSLEYLLMQQNSYYSFIPLNATSKNLTFKSAGIFHEKYVHTKWSEVYDGFFYIKEMNSCEKVN